MSTQPVTPTAEEKMLQGQSGIKSWDHFERTVVEAAEQTSGEPETRTRDLASLTKKDREEWRESGDAPIERTEPSPERKLKPAERLTAAERQKYRETGEWPLEASSANESKPEPKSANELTAEEREHWRQTGEWPLKQPEQKIAESKESAKTSHLEPSNVAPKTPEERRVEHEKNFSEFTKSAQTDTELKTALDAVKLDKDRGGVVLHALADLPGMHRVMVAKELASRPELTAAMAKATKEQVRDTVIAMAQYADARTRYGPEAERTIVPAVRAILQDNQIPNAVKAMLNESDVLIDVIHALGSDPNELAKFTQLAKSNPGAAIRHLATMESSLKQQSATASQRMQEQLTDARQRYSAAADRTIFPALDAIVGDRDIPPAVKSILNDSDVLVDLLYTLGSNTKEFAEFKHLAKTNPSAAVRKLITTEALVKDQLKANASRSVPERGADGKFQKSEPARPPLREPVEVGGRSSWAGDDGAAAVKTGDFRAAKAAFDRQYKASYRD